MIRFSRPIIGISLGLAVVHCTLDDESCDPEGCSRKTYEIVTQVQHQVTPIYRRVDTLDTGQLYVLVGLQQLSSRGMSLAAGSTKCISCESLLRNSRLTFSQPILAGADTLAASTNLLDSNLVSKVGTGGRAALLFNPGVRFKRGDNRISFTSDLVLHGDKIGSVNLEKILHVGERSSW